MNVESNWTTTGIDKDRDMTARCLRGIRIAAALIAVVALTRDLPSQAPQIRFGEPAGPVTPAAGPAPVPRTQVDAKLLEFDFENLEIGVAEYDEGPTGVTVFSFPGRVTAVVDVRGGAPGTSITDALRLGYERSNIDAITFAGGSLYGLEAAAAVAGQLRELRDAAGSGAIGAVPGAIIFDLGNRRFNTLSPDPALARAAFAAKRKNYFPLGARGAGRSARQGSLFGERAKSGQGGAYRQVGPTKIAVFTVVNAVGSIVDRDGRVVRCNHPAESGVDHTIVDHFRKHDPLTPPRPALAAGPQDDSLATGNTTITLVVTNQRLAYAELQRLAVQVHSSMGRGIQPFATAADGDALFAVSMQSVENPSLRPDNLAIVAAELAWDAVLASVPQPPAPAQKVAADPRTRDGFAGRYEFGTDAVLTITRSGDRLQAQATGRRPIYEFAAGGPASGLVQVGPEEFEQQTRWRDRIRFVHSVGSQPDGLILNPGLEHIFARRIN